MQYVDLMIGTMVMNTLSSLKTDIIWLDFMLFSLIIIMSYLSKDHKLNSQMKENLHYFFFPNKEENKITFMFKRGEESNRCKSLFHYLSTCNYKKTDIKNLIEDIFKKYDRHSDMNKEYGNIYRVDQIKSFNFNENIKGKVYTEEKESGESYNGKVTYKEFIYLEVYSETLSLIKIKEFIEECKIDYNKFLKDQMLDHQYLITVETLNDNGKKSDDLKISKEQWSSNVTFDSRFFPEKEETLATIDHFIHNKEWFKKKGLNHTLGILLSGEPGCGKTSFIKALMNYTGRHTVEIKLNDNFDFSDLKDIIYDEEIDDDILIPQDRRIIVFEDIDAMGNIVKDRNLKKKENSDASEKLTDELIKCLSTNNLQEKVTNKESDVVNISNKISKKENNNLSYLLNILDGINETPGRIIIMTTNRPEILDEALIRPGRIDIKINFSKATSNSMIEILSHFWNEDENLSKIKEKDIDGYIDLSCYHKKFTPAEIIDVCRKNNNLISTISKLKNLSNY